MSESGTAVNRIIISESDTQFPLNMIKYKDANLEQVNNLEESSIRLHRNMDSGKFIGDINNQIFNHAEGIEVDDFPLVIHTPVDQLVESKCQELGLMINEEVIQCGHKEAGDEIVKYLNELKKEYQLDYSNFISHPGNLFIKPLNRGSDEEQIREYFNNHCKFKSLKEINIFDSSNSEDEFAILKFSNHLDVDYLLDHLNCSINPFHTNSSIYLNRYLSKKERKLNDQQQNQPLPPLSSDYKYNSIILEDLDDFFPNSLTLNTFNEFINKFEIFNPIESIYIPIQSINDQGLISPPKFAFISFINHYKMDENILKILYFLTNLNFEEFMHFEPDQIYSIEEDLNLSEEEPVHPEGLKIAISQHKHNHYLYQIISKNQLFLYNINNQVSIGYLNVPIHKSIIAKFSKSSNLQETNVYVNNFAIIFQNNDDLWNKFWIQFGSNIKSAKIIKLNHNYSKTDDQIRKIGFVFYSSFKMALRAILLTNNKTLINPSNNQIINIQTSFAIQKTTNNRPKFQKNLSLPVYQDSNYFFHSNFNNDPAMIPRHSHTGVPDETFVAAPPHPPPPPPPHLAYYNPLLMFNYSFVPDDFYYYPFPYENL